MRKNRDVIVHPKNRIYFLCWIIFYIVASKITLASADDLSDHMDHPIDKILSSRPGEFLIDTVIHDVPDPCMQGSPAVAFDGVNYLIVWAEDGYYSGSYIYGSRVTPAGIILDSIAILISRRCYVTMPNLPDLAIAFDGTDYLVVWQDERVDYDKDIYGARVSPGGVVLDPDGFSISNAQGDQSCPALVFDGVNYLAVWDDHRNGECDIYGTRVSPGGTVLDTDGIAISTAPLGQCNPAVAFDGSNCLVVWEDSRSSCVNLYGARVTTGGTVIDTNGIAVSTAGNDQAEPSVVFDGVNYLVVWNDNRGLIHYHNIYGAHVTTAGVVIDSCGFAISSDSASHEPSIIFDGVNYMVVWSMLVGNAGQIRGARVTSYGVVLDPQGIVISATPLVRRIAPKIVFDDNKYFVVWVDCRGGSAEVYSSRVNLSGAVLDPCGIKLTVTANYQFFPSVSCNGADFLAVWCDFRKMPTRTIYGARITAGGLVLDSGGFIIPCDDYFNATDASVVFDGINYFVVWPGYNGIFGSRITQSGTMIDTNRLLIPVNLSCRWGGMPIAFASGGTCHLIAWSQADYMMYSDIYCARVASDGAILDTGGIILDTEEYYQETPVVAFDGANYLVAWADLLNGDIRGKRVNQDGVVLDSGEIRISSAQWGNYDPAVAFDGTNFLVVWSRGNGSMSDIYGSRVSPVGVVLDTIDFNISNSGYCRAPSVAFDGTHYLVAWQDSRSGFSSDIYASRVATSGNVIESFVVSTQPGDQVSPSLASSSAGRSLIVYSGFAERINNHPASAMRIWGAFYPFAGIEEADQKTPSDQRSRLAVYPNPFSKTATITLRLDDPLRSTGRNVKALIKIYDAGGRLVKRYAGPLSDPIPWPGRDDRGNELSVGIYFVNINCNGYNSTIKAIKVR